MESLCHGLNVCVSPQNSCVEILSPNVMMLEGRARGRRLGPEGGALMSGLVPLKEE